MYLEYAAFERTMTFCQAVFNTWDEMMKEFINMARDRECLLARRQLRMLREEFKNTPLILLLPLFDLSPPPSNEETGGKVHPDQDSTRSF